MQKAQILCCKPFSGQIHQTQALGHREVYCINAPKWAFMHCSSYIFMQTLVLIISATTMIYNVFFFLNVDSYIPKKTVFLGLRQGCKKNTSLRSHLTEGVSKFINWNCIGLFLKCRSSTGPTFAKLWKGSPMYNINLIVIPITDSNIFIDKIQATFVAFCRREHLFSTLPELQMRWDQNVLESESKRFFNLRVF